MENPKYWLIGKLFSWLNSFGSFLGLPISDWLLIVVSICSLVFGLLKAKKYWGVGNKPHGGYFIGAGFIGVCGMTIVVLMRFFKR